jgi:divalent metal cation (Fe/Co/Zn/Cd) transporter
VLFEDSAALLGVATSFIEIFAAGRPGFDDAASIGIGLVLAVTAIFLAWETRSLLIGEPASEALQTSILRIAEQDPVLQRTNGLLTVHLSPDHVVAALSAEFKDDARAPDIKASAQRIAAAVRAAHPEVRTLFLKPQTAGRWRDVRKAVESAAGQTTG